MSMNKEGQIPVWRQVGLKDSEYDLIVQKLGREPNYTELGVFSVLWSEHCAYKHSKSLLGTLPTKGPLVMVGPGENAGVVDVGDGLACAFKIESHNHPSAVEPFQAAATGIGGIVRDILAMGARPVALLGSLRFGPLSDERSGFLFQQVVKGISSYGNSLGVPSVGGEAFFAEPYRQNPLANVFCAGLMKHEEIHKGQAYGVGNSIVIIGHSTGRDGIHGCTFASEELGDDTEDLRPNVQVGDPFMEKLLIEACLEMMQKGAVVGIQDMGAAGIASSCAETAARAGTGLHLEVSKIPMREKDMTAYDVLLSESQERMLLIVRPDKIGEVMEISGKWGVNAVEIGSVTDTGNLEVFHNGVLEASIPVSVLTEGVPIYKPEAEIPGYIRETRGINWDNIRTPEFGEFGGILKTVLALPNVASKKPVYSQLDYMAGNNTVAGPPSGGAGVVRIEGTDRAIAMSADCNGRLVYLNPKAGAKWAVSEAARNVAVTGARPVAISNCLNFGNPERPEMYWQLKKAVEGMAEACLALDTPVTGGNVSLYNETEGEAVYPTPVVGMLGIIEDVGKVAGPGFRNEGDKIALIGRVRPEAGALAGSEYLEKIHGIVAGNPADPDLGQEKAIIDLLVSGARLGLFSSAQDLAEGGLAVALAECCMLGQNAAKGILGAEVSLGPTVCVGGVSDGLGDDSSYGVGASKPRPDAMLFGECNTAVVVSFDGDKEEQVRELCRVGSVPFAILGTVGGDSLKILSCGGDVVIDESVLTLKRKWENGLAEAIKK